MKIAINRCHGGFSLSEAAYKELGIPWDDYGYKYSDRDKRTAPELIACIEAVNKQGFGQLVPQETMDALSYNDGAGLNTQVECNALANALEALIKDEKAIKSSGLSTDGSVISFPVTKSALLMDKGGRLVSREECKGSKDDYDSAWSVDIDHVLDFIAFLRSCGGFSVC